MAVTLCELKSLKQLLMDFCVSLHQPILLHCDSQAAIHIAANPIFHECTKHIEIDFHFVYDAFQDGFITLRYIQSAFQPTDVYTKALPLAHFFSLIHKLRFMIFMF